MTDPADRFLEERLHALARGVSVPPVPAAEDVRRGRRRLLRMRVTMAGDMLESGFLPPSIELGRPGSGSNHIMPLFMMTPSSGIVTRLPQRLSRVCVNDTATPFLSITLR